MSFIKSIFKLLPLQDKMIFESSPDFACNTYPVYQKIREKSPSTKCVWIVRERPKNTHHADSVIEMNPSSVYEKLRAAYHLYTASGIVCSNIPVKRRENQVSLYLGHGSKTKRTKGLYEPGRQTDYVQVQSHFFDDVTMEEYGCRREQLVYLGYPRCDCFFEEKHNRFFENNPTEKFIIWLPTVRNISDGRRDVKASGYDRIGMPLIYSLEALKQFNQFLSERDVTILFKPHPAQDISDLAACSLSHIRVLTDAQLSERNTRLYELIADSAALITDYSSVFYDYLLLNRPIATTTDDLDGWKNNRGFAFDVEKIYDEASTRAGNLEALEAFVQSVIDGNDEKSAAREKYCQMTNMYRDGNASDRVAEFMIQKMKSDT